MKIGRTQFLEKKVIGADDGRSPLIVRYIIVRTPAFGIYLHKLCRSDYDRALHDHPWPFVSVILRGGYIEVHDQTIDGKQTFAWRKPGSVLLRPAQWRHRVIIGMNGPAWTLVLAGRREQRWGFYLPTGWCWWRKHDHAKNICADGILHDGGAD